MALTVPWRAPAKTEAAVTASVAVSAPQAGMGSTVRSQVRLAQGCRGFPSPTLTWALAPSSPVTGRAIGYWSCQLVQQDPLPAEIASRSLKTRTLQGQYLVWHPGIICAESVAEPACGVGIRAGSQHPSPFPWHKGKPPIVWLHLGPRKDAWGGAGPALILISVYQTGSPRSSNWPQSWSSTWAPSPSSAAWPLATHCPPGTAWSCARLMAPCSRYCPVPLPHHHLHGASSLKSTWGCWAASE